MSILGSIISKIFSHPAAAQPASTPSSSAQPTGAQTAAPAGAAPSSASSASASSASGAGASTAAAAPTTSHASSGASVDVAAILDGDLAQKHEKLDWRHSIVDLMKLLDLDSSLAARKELAKELNYTGDANDSATMNVWLHKQVMQKLAANGGKLPADLH